MATKFETIFSPIKKYSGKPVFLNNSAGKFKLSKGLHEITIFNWEKLDKERPECLDMLVECQILELAVALGKGWSKKLVPFAIIGGESHPIPLDEMDQQCDGVLFFDLANGSETDCPILFLSEPTENEAKPFAKSIKELDIQEG